MWAKTCIESSNLSLTAKRKNMKPTSSYKMSNATKSMLRLMKGTNEQRNGWKRAFIDAELCAEQAKRTAGKRSRDDNNQE